MEGREVLGEDSVASRGSSVALRPQSTKLWLEKASSGMPFMPSLAATLAASCVACRAEAISDVGPGDRMSMLQCGGLRISTGQRWTEHL